MARTTELITCRRILCFMVITGFMIHYMLRINMSIAIVDMVIKNNTNATTELRFDWDEDKRNEILGCFFWGYLLTCIPGGRLSEIYGTRLVLGVTVFLASILTMLTPLTCHWHYYWLLASRTCLGLTLGVAWPSIPPLAIRWIAPEDTSKFMSHTLACTLGAALTLPICGYLIAYLRWPSVFYVTGAISLVWSLAWFYLVYDSPGQHPRISDSERVKLEKEVKSDVYLFRKQKIPWLKILTSGPVWAIIIADIGLQFNTNIILNELPSYMDQVLHYNIKENGLLSSLPFIATYIMAVLSSYLADCWRKKQTTSTIFIRKFFTTVSFWIPTVLLIIQAFWGYYRLVSVIVFTLSQGFFAASVAGFVSNSMDISPIYSGTIFGLAFTGGSATGYISAKIVGAITHGSNTFEQWRYIFWFLIVVNIVTSIFYLIFASGQLQSWNPEYQAVEMKELKPEVTQKLKNTEVL